MATEIREGALLHAGAAQHVVIMHMALSNTHSICHAGEGWWEGLHSWKVI